MIRIIINNPINGTTRAAMVPERAPMRILMPELIRRLGLPPADPRGYPISYMLQKNEFGRGLRLLGPDDTLASAGIAEDETLTLTYRIVAGYLYR